ncbi:MAG: hypothetical protein IKM52_03190, partial [Clostridia bacterium]|nr:hypothetical protein [Clostridia bacterium]
VFRYFAEKLCLSKALDVRKSKAFSSLFCILHRNFCHRQKLHAKAIFDCVAVRRYFSFIISPLPLFVKRVSLEKRSFFRALAVFCFFL